MLLNRIKTAIIISTLLLFSATLCGAISEEKIASSAEEVAASWEDLLSSDLSIVIYNPEMGYWYVSRLTGPWVLTSKRQNPQTLHTS